MAEGLLDTNLFIHAHAKDPFTQECRRFLAGLENGQLSAHLDPLILHELSYALPHYVKQMGRAQMAEYLLMVLGWPGVHGEKDLMVEAVRRWGASGSLAFADAYLAALAGQRGCPVYSKNIRELEAQGVAVPHLLPGGDPP